MNKQKIDKMSGFFLVVEIELCKRFIQTHLTFQPYYYIPYEDLYSQYTDFIEKQHPTSKPVKSNRFWFLLKIALSEMNLTDVANTIIRRNQYKRLIYQGVGIKFE